MLVGLGRVEKSVCFPPEGDQGPGLVLRPRLRSLLRCLGGGGDLVVLAAAAAAAVVVVSQEDLVVWRGLEVSVDHHLYVS